MNKKIDVSIVVVTYNSFDTIKECIDSIEKTVKKNSFEIVVVDNASKDGTVKMVEERFITSHSGKRPRGTHPESLMTIGDSGQARMTQNGNIIIIENRENLGFSKANNQGIKASKESRYVLFLNPDTLVYENSIDGIVDFMDKTLNAGAATCFVELKNGKLDDSCHRGFPTPWGSFCYFTGLSRLFPKRKFFAGYNMTYLDFNKTHEIDSLAGSFMIVRRNIGERLGWWDEDFFFYGEDLDFCFRIKGLGYKIYFVPRYKALHYKGVSSGIKKVSESISKAAKETRLFATKHRFNAMRIFYRKHYQNKYPKVITWFIYRAISLKEKLSSL